MQALSVANDERLERLIKSLSLVPKVYVNDLLEMVPERYSNYVASVDFSYRGDTVPNALGLFLFDVESYGEHSPFGDLMLDCICEKLHNSHPDRFPQGEWWSNDPDLQEQAMTIRTDCWEVLQSKMVHDIEVVMVFLRMSFLGQKLDGKLRMVNSPVVEVW